MGAEAGGLCACRNVMLCYQVSSFISYQHIKLLAAPVRQPSSYRASRTRCGIASHDLRRGDPAPSRLAAVMRDARARILVVRILSRAESLTPRCPGLAISQILVKEHSSSGIVANSGEVSDSVCSRPAAAMIDARARKPCCHAPCVCAFVHLCG